MIYRMPAVLAWLARTFPGIRLTISKWSAVNRATHCEVNDVLFHFDSRYMDRKRFVAIACGAIEDDEVYLAEKMITSEDIVVEFGAGLGIAASRVHKKSLPKKHICYEANPLLEAYSHKLFSANSLNIELKNFGLGNGSALDFYAQNDYILSSYRKPDTHNDYRLISVPTVSFDQVLKEHQPTAIFCDIEGAELNFITAESFGSVTKIIIELHPYIYGVEGVASFTARMERHGFSLMQKQNDTYSFIRTV